MTISLQNIQSEENPNTPISLTLLVVILHDLDYFADLLTAWKTVGVPGVTILQSVGGFQAQDWANRSGLASLLSLFEQGRPEQRTLMALVDDQGLLERAIAEADRIVGGFDRPRSGILFTLPAGIALGLQKWGSKPKNESEDQPDTPRPSPLIQWFEDDLIERGEEQRLADWRAVRGTKIGTIIKHNRLEPVIVRTDTPLPHVSLMLLAAPHAAVACVVNSEDRLMGVINQQQLGEAMLVPIVPEEFMENPADYIRALDASNGKMPEIAADIMVSPVYVQPEESLDTAYQRMHQAGLVGIPVVDGQYRVLGYLSLLELLNICYPVTKSAKES